MVEVSRSEFEPVFNFYRSIEYVELNDEMELVMHILRRTPPSSTTHLTEREAREYFTFKRRMEQSRIEIESSVYSY